MFHQVFICDKLQEPGCTLTSVQEEAIVENIPSIVKEENNCLVNTKMGIIQSEILQMVPNELKMDDQDLEESFETKSSLNTMPLSVTKSDVLSSSIIMNKAETPEYENGKWESKCEEPMEVMDTEDTKKNDPSFLTTIINKAEKSECENSKWKNENGGPVGITSTEDTEKYEAVRFLEINGINNYSSPCEKISLSRRAEEKDKSSKIGTIKIVESHLKKINYKTQTSMRSVINEARENELRTKYNIKDCTVHVTRLPVSQYLTHKPIHLDNEDNPTLVNCENNSISENEEWQFGLDDILDSESNSDWEEEYLAKSSKKRQSLNKNSKIVKLLENANCPSSLQLTNNTFVKGLDVSSNNVSGPKNPNSTHLSEKSRISNQLLRQGECALIDSQVARSVKVVPSMQYVNTENIEKRAIKYTSIPIIQLQLPIQAIINSTNLHYIPQNNFGRVANIQIQPNNNVKTEPLIFNDLQSKNSNAIKVISNTGLKRGSSIPHKTKDRDNFKRKYRKILPKSYGQTPLPPIALATDDTSFGPLPPQSGCDVEEDDPYLLPVPDFTHRCNKCDKYFNMDQYHKHMRYSLCGGYRRKPEYQCDICGKFFSSKVKLECHNNSHNNSRPFKCIECDRRFNSMVARRMHIRDFHLKKKLRYLCYFCGYVTPNREHLEAHERVHQLPEGTETPKPFKCLTCGKGFISRWRLVRHKKDHQLKKCTNCLAEFKTVDQLRKHKEDVHNVASITYKCDDCGVQFRHRQSLKDHRDTLHAAVVALTCAICNKSFKRKNNLKQHMITHSDERPLSCSECGDRFKRYSHLKQHISAFHGDGRK